MALTGTLLEVERRPIETAYGRFQLSRGLDLDRGAPVLTLGLGDLASREPVLARVHSSCVTSEFFGARDCDCAEQLAAAIETIARKGRGLLFYLMQEGRGAGFVAKARDRMMVQASDERIHTFEAYERLGLPHDSRSYQVVADALRAHDIRAPLRLLTNNPDKVSGLEQAKVATAGTEPLRHEPSPWNRHYLDAKFRSGHDVHAPGLEAAAVLPEPVDWLEPRILPDLPRFAYVARYLLPLAEPGERVRWYRCHVYVDLAQGRERVVLEAGDGGAGHVQEQPLLERLPLARPGPARARWRALRAQLDADGAGRVLFLAADETGPPDPETAALLERGRRAR